MIARRSGARRVFWSAVAAAAVIAAWFGLRDPIRLEWRRALLRRALAAAETAPAGRMEPRLVTATTASLASSLTIPLPRRRSANAAAAALLANIGGDATRSALHDSGVALFIIGGEEQAAVQQFRDAAEHGEHAAWWSDLAAAEIRAADVHGEAERYVAALVAADRALALDARLAAARANRALAIERLGFERASIAEWQQALALEGSSSRAAAVSMHVAELSRKRTARELWGAASERIASLPRSELERLTDAHPQEARLWGESVFLSLWAQQYQEGEGGDVYLDAARRIGDRLASRSGERLLQEAVAVIDSARASGDHQRLTALADAQAAYVAARVAFVPNTSDRSSDLSRAQTALAASGSPMAGVAELYMAMNAIRSDRIAEARPLLAALLGRAEAKGHLALAADAQRFLALVDAMAGRWGDAIHAAQSARDRFVRLGERANAAEAEMTMADVLGVLGHPQPAWRHLVRAATAFSAAGLPDRLQVSAAEMNYLELRRRRWPSALAISRVEVTLGETPALLAHAHLRAGAAAYGAGDRAAAYASLSAARAAAADAGDAWERLLADIGAVEGRTLIASDPAAALERMTESIRFQIRVGRAFMLPELYLERGRAQRALGARTAARADFEEGISALEQQRSGVRDHELRAGLFDDPRDLFADAIAAAIEDGDLAAAFDYLERGRARTLRDELGEDVKVPAKATLTAFQNSLEPGALLLSYAFVGARLAIFAVDREGIEVHFADGDAERIGRQAARLVRAVKNRGDVPAAGGPLYDALILPVRERLARATTVIVAPDAALEEVPFAALFDRRAKTYLIDSHELLLAPGAAVFAACARRAAQTSGARPRSVAMFANPSIPRDLALSNLPAAESEAPAVARLYAEARILTGERATAARFRSDAPRSDVVQFSGHARIDRAEPWRSALILDEPLTARDLASMRFPRTRVAVLSACSTLTSDAGRVEGTSALARAFLMAGVPAVVGSLWDIDDDEAAAFTMQLHERLSRGLPVAAAVRDVQREMLRSRHPAEWAAFTVLGAD